MKADLPLPVKQKKLYSSLTSQIDNGHFKNAVKTTDKLLRLDPEDSLAQKTRLWLFLQTELYQQALDIATSSKDDLKFEQAYALYRLQREAEAVKLLESLEDGESRGVLHLQAQLSYRCGQYQTALDLYNDLLDTSQPNSEEHTDIQTNLASTQSQLDFISSGFRASLSKLPRTLTDRIEDLPPPSLVPIQVTKVPAAEPDTEAPKVKSVRKSRLPKGVVVGQTPLPDPERWLKKSERSSFQAPRGKKGRGGGASQGLTPVEQAALSASGGGGGKKGKKRK
ncbi:hypothetical protein DL96DRAFT_311756 [Flagelloscypha sp. PMI_526]|nr:hypothetical protein DL96DRAFT_311756 [Flagelloscypha sp. PMI_526]